MGPHPKHWWSPWLQQSWSWDLGMLLPQSATETSSFRCLLFIGTKIYPIIMYITKNTSHIHKKLQKKTRKVLTETWWKVSFNIIAAIFLWLKVFIMYLTLQSKLVWYKTLYWINCIAANFKHWNYKGETPSSGKGQMNKSNWEWARQETVTRNKGDPERRQDTVTASDVNVKWQGTQERKIKEQK